MRTSRTKRNRDRMFYAARVWFSTQAFFNYGLKTMDAKVPANSLVPIP